MNLSDHDLSQIDEPYARSLSHCQLLDLFLKVLGDLKKARDRINQTPKNSSTPSGSMPPWAKVAKKTETDEDDSDEESLPQNAEKAPKDSEDISDSDESGAEDLPKSPSEKDQGKKTKKASASLANSREHQGMVVG